VLPDADAPSNDAAEETDGGAERNDADNPTDNDSFAATE
jgi:hypothetical protein